VVSVLSTRPKVCGFEPNQGDGFLRVIKIRSTWEVLPEVPCCKILWHVKELLKSHRDRQTKFSFPSPTRSKMSRTAGNQTVLVAVTEVSADRKQASSGGCNRDVSADWKLDSTGRWNRDVSVDRTTSQIRRGPHGQVRPEFESSTDFPNFYFGYSGKAVE
jgi:hypothetical protein